jgi:hypothetical protein
MSARWSISWCGKRSSFLKTDVNQLAALTSGLRKTYGPARKARGPSFLSLSR